MISFNFIYSSFYLHRANNNWQINYASITKTNENSSQTSKKQRDTGDTARDGLAYSCLLKNELLGTGIDDVKSVAEDRNENVACNARRSLFKYQSPTKQVIRVFVLPTCFFFRIFLQLRKLQFYVFFFFWAWFVQICLKNSCKKNLIIFNLNFLSRQTFLLVFIIRMTS